MEEPKFPADASEVLATLADIHRYQNRPELVELLTHSYAEFRYSYHDNWNGGIDIWQFVLQVRVVDYARLGDLREGTEKELLASLGYLRHLHERDPIEAVSIVPRSPKSTGGSQMAASESAVNRIWSSGFFRLFLSHVSAHKRDIARVKQALKRRGIDGFVAHEDIEPSREWQAEIELALQTMDSLALFITSGFHASNWTDQEVGWALGRGLLTLPIHLDSGPYGFVAKVQSVRGRLDHPNSLSQAIAETLLANPLTTARMRRCALARLSRAESLPEAQAIATLLPRITEWTEPEKNLARRACEENPYAKDPVVSDAVLKAVGPASARAPAPSVPLDDIPF